jgi:hypothetical protein
MKRISLWILTLAITASTALAQDTATQQQLDKLSGQIQDVLAAQEQQNKRLDALEREISDSRDKANTPVANDYASRDDLKKIADQVSEVDRKRQDDSDMIAKQIDGLTKLISATPATPIHHSSNTSNTGTSTGTGTSTSTGGTSSPDPNIPTNGYYYEVKQDDTLSAIVKAYRDKGVKVTTKMVLKANPGLDPNKLYAKTKIFIPDPAAK